MATPAGHTPDLLVAASPPPSRAWRASENIGRQHTQAGSSLRILRMSPAEGEDPKPLRAVFTQSSASTVAALPLVCSLSDLVSSAGLVTIVGVLLWVSSFCWMGGLSPLINPLVSLLSFGGWKQLFLCVGRAVDGSDGSNASSLIKHINYGKLVQDVVQTFIFVLGGFGQGRKQRYSW